MSQKFLTWLLLLIGLSLIFQVVIAPRFVSKPGGDDVVFENASSFVQEYAPVLKLLNKRDQVLNVATNCPSGPLKIERYSNGVWGVLAAKQGKFLQCEGEAPSPQALFQPKFFELQPHQAFLIDYAPWKDEIFSELGKYRATLSLQIDGVQKQFTNEFEIKERGFISSIGYHFFFRPLFNGLLALTGVMPGHNFGLALILLTVIVRLLLFIPSQKALKSQRIMSSLQPELQALRKRHEGDQQRISLETMALWKKHKASPVGGCLPLLLQLPVLIALYYTILTGFSPYQVNLLYPFVDASHLLQVNTHFFELLDLRHPNMTWLPIVVGLLQFLQMKMSFSRMKKRAEPGVIADKGTVEADLQNSMMGMNKTMIYFMPLFLMYVITTLPSAVGLYLLITTLFSILQQYFVNRSTQLAA